MNYKTLITLNGHAPYDADQFSFEVITGGALQITSPSGKVDLIGPGFWVALLDESAGDRLDWEFLAPQQPEHAGDA